jgi:hypothetical protein
VWPSRCLGCAIAVAIAVAIAIAPLDGVVL